MSKSPHSLPGWIPPTDSPLNFCSKAAIGILCSPLYLFLLKCTNNEGFAAIMYALLEASVVVVLLLLTSSSSVDASGEPVGQEWRGEGDQDIVMALEGGIMDVAGGENSAEAEELARFAVDEHNKQNENVLLQFSRLVKAKEQVVSGIMHHLTVEVIEGGKKKLYEAKVWVQAWLNSKKLHEFNPIGDSSSVMPADLGARWGEHEAGWREVPAHDPIVQDAANHAVKSIQQRSNSLFPYELLEILHAKAEVADELAKFDMLLKLKRGNVEEKLKVEVHKNIEGTFRLNQMSQVHQSDIGN